MTVAMVFSESECTVHQSIRYMRSAADRDGVVPAGVLVERRLQHADGVGVLVGLQDAHLGEAQLRQRLLLV